MEGWWAFAAGGAAAAAAAAAVAGLREAARLVVEHLVFEVRPAAGQAALVLLSRRRATPQEAVLRPAGVACLRLVHLSDLHLHRWPGGAHRLALEAVRRLGPDVVVLTGDFVDRLSWGAPLAAYLRRLTAAAPAAAVLGNHDHERPHVARFVLSCLEQAGATVLLNRRVVMGAKGIGVELVGVDSPDLGRDDLPLALSRPAAAWPGADRTAEAPARLVTVRVTLAHSYHVLEHQPAERCGALVLVGDTHGGQLVFPLLGPVWSRWVHRHRYVEGVHRVGSTWLYVNRGVGTIGPPLRWRCPPEVAAVDLCLHPKPS